MTDIRTPIGNLRPYHVYPLIVYIRDHYRDMDEETSRALMAHVAMHSPDPSAAAALADIHDDAWGSLYPREDTVTPDTADTIDKFIATYGHSTSDDDALLERLILNPTPDYGAVLASEDAQSDAPATETVDATMTGIDNFLGAHGMAETIGAETATEEYRTDVTASTATTAVANAADITPSIDDNAASATTNVDAGDAAASAAIPDTEDAKKSSPISASASSVAGATPAVAPAPATASKISGKDQTPASSLSESLAKIYIRQGRYRRAYEILSDLNLKNPEKSIYFADQLRFLRKVISLLPPEKEGEGGAR